VCGGYAAINSARRNAVAIAGVWPKTAAAGQIDPAGGSANGDLHGVEDRFGRSLIDCLNNIEELGRCRIRFIATTQNLDTDEDWDA
jgi:hypothetical protein